MQNRAAAVKRNTDSVGKPLKSNAQGTKVHTPMVSSAISSPSATVRSKSRRMVYFLGLVPFPNSVRDNMELIWCLIMTCLALWNAYRIRITSIQRFGRVIHEYDPYFNLRATRYLAKNGSVAFFQWFDHMSWYPLGRPIGTTTYPGMQFTAVAIYRLLRFLGPDWSMTLKDVCCFIPCWFGVLATLLTGGLTYECTYSKKASVIAMLIMAIIPAHAMRSMGGEYDNECIALSAMLLTFYTWLRASRPHASMTWAILSGLGYFYMAATWGGYTYVVNLISIHCAVLVSMDWIWGMYCPSLVYNYCIFYGIGTALATRIPVIGWGPLRNLETMAPLLLFIYLLGLIWTEGRRRAMGFPHVWSPAVLRLRLQTIAVLTCLLLCVSLFVLLPTGYFGPLTARVRGLFVEHTRTGNPLVDSVAEHQPISGQVFWSHLHYASIWSHLGMMLLLPLQNPQARRSGIFLFIYALTANYFASKMARLILLLSPVASALSGFFLDLILKWALAQLWFCRGNDSEEESDEPDSEWNGAESSRSQTHRKARIVDPERGPDVPAVNFVQLMIPKPVQRVAARMYASLRVARVIFSFAVLFFVAMVHIQPYSFSFVRSCEIVARMIANPQVVFETRPKTPGGPPIIVDDYLKAYLWLGQNTPEDARILAWWDYGYQIAGIANRTTFADGNTWNHEHIASLARMLTGPMVASHRLIRHVADYVLVWANSPGDDMAKSPHIARIANSVFRDHCPNDPLCRTYHVGDRSNPTDMMKESLLFNLVMEGKHPSAVVPEQYFKEVFQTQRGLVRIYQVVNVSNQSKVWLADPSNWNCDHPGSWYCPGSYPSAKVWKSHLEQRRNFRQIENFNTDTPMSKEDLEYREAYLSAHRQREQEAKERYRAQRRRAAMQREAKAASSNTPDATNNEAESQAK